MWLFSLVDEEVRAQKHGMTYWGYTQLYAGPITPQPMPFPSHSFSVGHWSAASPLPTGCLRSPEQTSGVSGGFHLVLSAEDANYSEQIPKNSWLRKRMNVQGQVHAIILKAVDIYAFQEGILFCVEGRLPHIHMFVCSMCACVCQGAKTGGELEVALSASCPSPLQGMCQVAFPWEDERNVES